MNLMTRLAAALALTLAASGAQASNVLVVLSDENHLDLKDGKVLATSATADGQHHLWLRFAPLGAGLADALERHLFRLHRRQIAEARLMARQAD